MSKTEGDLKVIASGALLAFGGSVFGNFLTYAYGVVIALYLGAEGVGLYFLGLVLMQFLSAVCRVGLSEGLLRFVAIHVGNRDVARTRSTIATAATLTAVTSLSGGILLFMSAEALSVHIFGKPSLAEYLRWFAVAIPCFSLFTVLSSGIQALKRMDFVVLARDVVQPTAMCVMAYVCLGVFDKAGGFLCAYVISVIAALGVCFVLLQRAGVDLWLGKLPVSEGRILLAFSLPIAVSDVANYLLRWADTFLVSFFRSAAELGIYTAAVRTALLLNLLAISLISLYAPVVAEHYHGGRRQDVEHVVRTLVRWGLMLGLPIVVAMVLLSREILLLWGKEFSEGASVLAVLSISQLVFIPSVLLAFALLMCGKQYVELGNVVLGAVVNIALVLVLIPRYGILGAATAAFASQAILLSLRLVEVRVLLGVGAFGPGIIKPILATGVTYLVISMLHERLIEVAALVSIGSVLGWIVLMSLAVAVVYVAALYLLGFEKDDVTLLKELGNGKGWLQRVGSRSR